MSGFIYPSTTKCVEGAVYETNPETGNLICINPGITTWSSDWPDEAKSRVAYLEGQIAELRSALAQQAKGEGDGGGHEPG